MKTALRMLTFAFALMLISSAYAQTGAPAPGAAPAPAAGAPSTTAAPAHNGPCKDDVQNFCSTVQKGGGRVLTCLKQHEGQLSARCEAAMKRHASQQSAPATQAAPTQAMPAPVPAPAPAP